MRTKADLLQPAWIVSQNRHPQHHATIDECCSRPSPMPSPKRSSHDHKIGSSEVVECGMGGWIDELGKSLRAIQNPVKKIHGRLHKKEMHCIPLGVPEGVGRSR